MNWSRDLQHSARSLLHGALSWIGSLAGVSDLLRDRSRAARARGGGDRFRDQSRAAAHAPLRSAARCRNRAARWWCCCMAAVREQRISPTIPAGSRLPAGSAFRSCLPVQVRDNNRGYCFNWFRGTETARDQGEALSIREMVAFAATALATHSRRTFVAGLSAGGAMAARCSPPIPMSSRAAPFWPDCRWDVRRARPRRCCACRVLARACPTRIGRNGCGPPRLRGSPGRGHGFRSGAASWIAWSILPTPTCWPAQWTALHGLDFRAGPHVTDGALYPA